MTSFPGSPRLVKGAIVGVDAMNPLASVVVFQYNPDTMTRSLEARSTGGGDTSDRSEAFRLTGPPKETISLNIEVDATDQLEQANPLALIAGISPTLSALEMLLYPKSLTVIANSTLAHAGNIEIIPPEAPLTLFVWGATRVLPVRITGLNITEEAYDPSLNPIRAKVDLKLTVLSYMDLKITNPGFSLFMVHQIAKEVMATSNVAVSTQNLTTSIKLG
jgi:Contractile injection system tube protein